MEPLIVAAFNTALDKDRREPWAGGMLEAAYRRGRSRAADLRSCSGMERR
jgi:hypothetical protein